MTACAIVPKKERSLSEVASIVHDLRNPLATIHGSAEMLVRTSAAQPQVHRIARNMYSASLRMRELLDDCLGRSREGEIELCSVRELVADTLERIAMSAELQCVNIAQVIEDGLEIAVDRYRIHRVLVNLLVNALEAMPGGGTILISAVSEIDSVLIEVCDSGPGVDPEISGRLFEPFVTSGKPHGVGLGLAFSRQTVMDHGGQMWAESSPRGARFAFRLPKKTALGFR